MTNKATRMDKMVWKCILKNYFKVELQVKEKRFCGSLFKRNCEAVNPHSHDHYVWSTPHASTAKVVFATYVTPFKLTVF